MTALALALALGGCRTAAEPAPAEPAPAPIARAVRGSELPAPAQAQARLEPGPELRGLCDASAAIAIGDLVIVADDERNVLRIFDWAHGAEPVGAIDLEALSPQFAGKEADLEGMAALPDGTVWITGSHDSGKGTERAPSRQRLFSLRFATAPAEAPSARGPLDASLAHGPWPGLIEQGSEQSQLYGIVVNTVGKTSKDPNGLSIEGLAAGPNGSLLFGFRAPVHGGKALIERLDDPVAAVGGKEPAFTGPRWLDLGGRGIRDLAAEPGVDGSWLIVAGDPAEGDLETAVYRWRGFDDGKAPELLLADTGELNPEAIVQIRGTWWLLSDDGGREIGGHDCKKLPEAERRARTAKLAL